MVTRRIIKMIEDEANKDPKGYNHWYDEFSAFLKEGLFSEQEYQD